MGHGNRLIKAWAAPLVGLLCASFSGAAEPPKPFPVVPLPFWPFGKQDKSVAPTLKKMVSSKENLLGRFHALWTLEGIGSLDAALTREMLKDPEPRMRVQAIRASETLYKAGDKSFAADYAKLASDKDTTVAIQALMTMNLLKTADSATVAKATMDSNKAAGIQLVAGTILNPAAAAGGRGGGRGAIAGPTLTEAQQASVNRGQTIYAELMERTKAGDPRLVLTFPVELPANTTSEQVEQWLSASGFTRVQAERQVGMVLLGHRRQGQHDAGHGILQKHEHRQPGEHAWALHDKNPGC